MGQSSTPEASLVPRCSHGHSVGLLTAIATVWLGAAAQAQVVDAAALEQEARDLRAEVRRLTSEQRYGEAIPKAERLIIVAEQLFGPSHPTVATLLTNLAELYERMGRDDDAGREDSYGSRESSLESSSQLVSQPMRVARQMPLVAARP